MVKKRNVNQALEIGETMAAATLRRRRAAAKTRRQALAKVAAKTSAKAKRKTKTKTKTRGRVVVDRKGFIEARGTPTSTGVLIAEGDSWFDYPFNDVLKDLEDIYGFDVESVAHKGDTVEEMAFSGGQLDEFARRVEKVLRGGARPRAILLSGGGNDIAGDEFGLLLNHAGSSIAGLNESIVAGVIDERLHDAYVTILGALSAVCEAQIGELIPIIVHGYDYPVPDGRGFAGGWGPLPGPWLEPGFNSKGYGTMTTRRQIIVKLMDRFNTMLRRLAGKAPFAHVRYLDLRKTLPTGKTYKQWWGNELHPTKKGFEAVTKKFAAIV